MHTCTDNIMYICCLYFTTLPPQIYLYIILFYVFVYVCDSWLNLDLGTDRAPQNSMTNNPLNVWPKGTVIYMYDHNISELRKLKSLSQRAHFIVLKQFLFHVYIPLMVLKYTMLISMKWCLGWFEDILHTLFILTLNEHVSLHNFRKLNSL